MIVIPPAPGNPRKQCPFCGKTKAKMGLRPLYFDSIGPLRLSSHDEMEGEVKRDPIVLG